MKSLTHLVRSLATVLAGVVAVTGAGVAAADWTSNGAGTATARSGTALPLTTTATAVTTGLLYPGGPAGDVRLTIVNPNPYPVRVTGISAAGTVSASGGIGTCTTTGVTFGDRTGGWDVAAGGATAVTLPGAATMSTASQNGCQGAMFTIPVALTGASI